MNGGCRLVVRVAHPTNMGMGCRVSLPLYCTTIHDNGGPLLATEGTLQR